ncbi:MAG TPA: MarR family transcriptional regulator [Sphingobacterium sp.]|nr:MarR family transcriptional regulator [Sphingobacterium sp.]
MRIEDCIKIKGFLDDYHRVTVNVVYTSNWLTTILEHRANHHGITLQQFNALRILRGQYPNVASNAMIRERMVTGTPDISRLVDRLVLKGLVFRHKNVTDKRAVDVKITQKGLQLLEDIEEEMMLSKNLCQNLTTEEACLLSHLLDKLRGKESII